MQREQTHGDSEMDLAKKYTTRLEELKSKVQDSYLFFKKNADRFDDFMRFVFYTALTNEDIEKLQSLNKPQVEFNVLESLVNQLIGEFASQEPSIVISAADGVKIEQLTPEYLQMIQMLEGYLKETLCSSHNDGLQNKIMRDLLGGGFSVVEIYTEYNNELSFDQSIKVSRVFDPTLTGFDPLARKSHKGDGGYCFQLYPRTKEEFEDEFGKEATEQMKFSRMEGFNWSYQNEKQCIILVCDFYEKVIKKEKIVKISTGHVVLKKHYEELLQEWNNRGFIEQAPIIIEERYTEIESIERYQMCGDAILTHQKTDYKMLPLVFIDGNSVVVKDTNNNASTQMTRPYCYQAKGVQRLKNFAGQTVGSEIENMVQHKFKVAVEAVPEEFQEAYRNVQLADVLMYNAFYKDDPQTPLPPPMEIQRTPTPPIVENMFMGSDRVTQTILGSYNSVLSTNQTNISGVAVANGAIQSNAAASPYLLGYINGLNRIAEIMIDLIPKYIVTPRTLPIRLPDGKRGYRVVNDNSNPSAIKIGYKPNDLMIRVEAGVNSALQKQVALDQIIKMMQASPLFSQFINTMGLETILDNLDIRGIDQLKAMSVQFMNMEQEKAQQAMNKEDPQIEVERGIVQVEAAKVMQREKESEQKLAIDAARVAIEKQKVDAQVLQVMNDIETKNAKVAIEQEKVDSENARTAVETAIELGKTSL